MSEASIRTGSLVLYKIHPALVHQVTDKIEIELEGGKRKRVRPKDVTPLHPGPLASLGALDPPAGDVEEAWALLEGETATLAELAELVYGEYTPASAWASWLLLDDGLYFGGKPDAISGRSPAQVEAELATRREKAEAARAWDLFLEQVRNGALDDAARKRLAEVERVALGQSDKSRVLDTFEVKATPEAAHAFLVRCGYWDGEHNPWPQRLGVILAEPDSGVPDLAEDARLDLTDLQSWAIDDAGNTDPDDAISIDGERLWVHVADVAALVRPGGHLDQAAQERGANLYLPEHTWTMLPPGVTERLGLGLSEVSPALSFGFSWDGTQLDDIRVAPSLVRVTRTTYDDVDRQMDAGDFARIRAITETYRAARRARNAARIELPEVSVRIRNGEILIKPLPALASRDMVTDAMLMAGEAAARFAVANAVPIPFAIQPEPEEIRAPQGLAAMYAYRRMFKPSRVSLQAEPHFGLGLPMYARATSPLRRYPDLLVHQQLRAFALGRQTLDADAVAVRVAGLDRAGGLVRRAERQSNLHWKLAWLARNPDWQGDAVIVALEERRVTVIVPELALETRIRLREGMQADQVIRLAVQQVDLPALAAYFRVLGD